MPELFWDWLIQCLVQNNGFDWALNPDMIWLKILDSNVDYREITSMA